MSVKRAPSRAPKKKKSTPEWIEALFSAKESQHSDSPLPAVVARNRRERARKRLLDALESRGTNVIPDELRADTERLIRRWAERHFEDAFGEMEAFEIRCAEESELLRAEASGNRKQVFAAMERAFRQQVIKRYGQIEIRGLQLSERVVQKLETAYVPLFLEDRSRNRVIKSNVIEGVEVHETPRREVTQVLSDHESVLVIGGRGSGKTTLLSYLAAQVADKGLKLESGKVEKRVPFVVPVRSLKRTHLDEAAIAETAECDPSFLSQVLAEGRALLLVDGIDEARGNGANSLLGDLRAFMAAHPRSRLLVTSRHSGLPGMKDTQIEGFASTHLVAMTRGEVDDFIDKWCLAAELSVQKEESKARNDARAAAEDLKRRVHMSRAVEQLAETPLLCTILCVVHRFLGQQIPERRAALYDTCTNVLLYEWDRAKFPPGAFIGKLDAHAKRRILSAVAREMHEAKQAEMGAVEVVQRFAALLPSLGGRPEEAEQIISEIRDRSGLLVERRPGYFAFSHLTFQEYLTATDYVREGAYAKLLGHADDPWWDEVVMLASGIPGADAARLVEALLRIDGKRTGRATLLAARCVETSIELPQSLRKNIEQRLEALIPPKSEEEIDLLVGFGNLIGPVLLKALAKHSGGDWGVPVAIALGRLRYEPACPSIAQWIGNSTVFGNMEDYYYVEFEDRRFSLIGLTVGAISALVLLDMALHSAVALNSLRAGMQNADGMTVHIVKQIARGALGSQKEATRIAASLVAALQLPKAGAAGRHRSKRGAHSDG